MADFTHLHTHSHYSLLDGLSKIDPLIARVKELGMDSLALTDHGAMFGLIEFYQKAQKAGIKPILGVETYVARRTLYDKQAGIDASPFHLTLLVENLTGYQNLIQLVTTAHLKGFYYRPRIDHDLLAKYHQGLILLTGCLNGELPRLIQAGKLDAARKLVQWYLTLFDRDHLYFELQHHPSLPEQRTVNEALAALGQEFGVGLVATADSHYLQPDDRAAHETLLAIATGKDVDDRERMSLKDLDLSLASGDEMARRFANLPEAIANTQKIAAMVNLELPLGQSILPSFPLPKGEPDSMGYLRRLAEAGLQRRYPAEERAKATEQLTFELSVFEKMGFADYLLIVQDFINWAKDHGVVVGPGRGSAAGSVAAYCLGITDLEPMRYGLLFERFLNPDRISLPDIDVDFADDRRDEVLRYVVDKYGADRVSQIITFGTMAARGAIRDTARALGLSYEDGDRIAKLIPAVVGATIQSALDEVTELKEIYRTEPMMKHLIDMAKQLEGVARHASTHACGIVISKEPLTSYVPLTISTRGELVSTQYAMWDIEAIGLLKMDFLGLSNLTIIKNALRIIRKLYDKEIEILDLPLDDRQTYAILSRAETTGVFQLESDGMKRYLKELKPSEFEDIIAMCALYRPGPMEFIPDFVARKHGKKAIQYLHPAMEPVLKPTYGIMVYQEQIMQLSRVLAGFTPGEADTLRKGVGKKIKAILDKVEPQFYAGCQKVGFLTDQQARQLWQEWLAWAKYGFNKSHAACYALIAYQTAWLKAHYPAAFMAALLTSDFSNLDRLAIELAECERMGIKVLPPSVNESFVEFGVVPAKPGNTKPEQSEGSRTAKEQGPKPQRDFSPPQADRNDDKLQPSSDDYIRFGLMAIKNVGLHVAEKIYEERQTNGRYQSLEDFLRRLGPEVINRKVIENLAKAGALDEFADRAELLGNLDLIVKFSVQVAKEAASGQIDLFGTSDFAADTAIKLELGLADPVNKTDRLAWEKELLGAYLSEHPLDEYRAAVEATGMPIRDLAQTRSDRSTTIAGVIQSLESKFTKKGDKMAFGQFEDFTGRIELLIFSRALQANPELFVPGKVLEVSGTVRAKDGTPKFVVDSAKPLTKIIRSTRTRPNAHSRDDSFGASNHESRITNHESIDVPSIDPATPALELTLPNPLTHELLAELKTLLASNPGDTTITFLIEHNGATVR